MFDTIEPISIFLGLSFSLISSYKLSDGLEKEESLHDLINHINEMNVDDIYDIFNDIPKECR